MSFSWPVTALIAQQPDAASPEGTSTVNTTEESSQVEQPANADANVPKRKQEARRGSFVVAPLPIASPALGTGIVPVLCYIFPLKKSDTVSPPSVLSLVGLITNNHSRTIVLAGQLYLRENTYRITSLYVRGNLNYNVYRSDIAAGGLSPKLAIRQEGYFFFGEFIRRIPGQFFVGPRFISGHSNITRRDGQSWSVPDIPEIGLETGLRSLGVRVIRDTRPNRFYPVSGTLFDFNADFFSKMLGSKYSFQSYEALFNKYHSVGDKQVFAISAYSCATGGNPPYYGECVYGMNNALRGYEAGQYFGKYMVTGQLEYRLVLPMRFGLVGFGGIGGIGPGGTAVLKSSEFLPSVGGGLRFLLSKQYHVNLRADVGVGRDKHTVALGIGEAF